MVLADGSRRPWRDSDKTDLVRYWEAIGSIFLISLLMDRPEGAIQTEASRLSLPRRNEDKGCHRKKWTDDENVRLDDAVAKCRTPDGKIRITEVADIIGRSVDAVASKLSERFESGQDLRDTIIIPEDDLRARAAAIKSKAPSASGKKSGIRKCICCQKPFNSSWIGNRVCKRCSNTQDDTEWY